MPLSILTIHSLSFKADLSLVPGRASRLHFIGTWKARNEALVERLSSSGPQPAVILSKHRIPRNQERQQSAVVHLDMDAFFATVAGLEHPSLRGKPLAVSHSNSSTRGSGGEISSCNYEARALGVRAGMWMGRAKEICPDLIVMPYQFDKYQVRSPSRASPRLTRPSLSQLPRPLEVGADATPPVCATCRRSQTRCTPSSSGTRRQSNLSAWMKRTWTSRASGIRLSWWQGCAGRSTRLQVGSATV